MENPWEAGNWKQRLLQLKNPRELTADERAKAHNLVANFPTEERREDAVPLDREVAVIALKDLLKGKCHAHEFGYQTFCRKMNMVQ